MLPSQASFSFYVFKFSFIQTFDQLLWLTRSENLNFQCFFLLVSINKGFGWVIDFRLRYGVASRFFRWYLSWIRKLTWTLLQINIIFVKTCSSAWEAWEGSRESNTDLTTFEYIELVCWGYCSVLQAIGIVSACSWTLVHAPDHFFGGIWSFACDCWWTSWKSKHLSDIYRLFWIVVKKGSNSLCNWLLHSMLKKYQSMSDTAYGG